MNKRILLGIDANLSPPAQHALRFASNFLAQSSPDVCLVLLHVIPVPYGPSFSWGTFNMAIRTFTPVTQQRMQAEHALWRARTALKQQGVTQERITWLQRVGTPADEIVKAARELGVDRIVIGSRGNTLAHRIGRVLMGSTSRRVMHHAPCPVTLVVPPGKQRARSLVAWYKEAVRRSLHEHSGSLLVFTAFDVAQLFVPPKRTVGSKELEAAALALEQLASDGLLYCQKVKGEWRYLND